MYLKNLQFFVYEIINNELKKNIEKNGDRLITLDPQLDIDKQNEQIYSFIEQKVDGIFINPIDAKKIEPAQFIINYFIKRIIHRHICNTKYPMTIYWHNIK